MIVSKNGLVPASSFETYAEYVAAYSAIGQKQFLPETMYDKLRSSYKPIFLEQKGLRNTLKKR
jgi:hypothetical protein